MLRLSTASLALRISFVIALTTLLCSRPGVAQQEAPATPDAAAQQGEPAERPKVDEQEGDDAKASAARPLRVAQPLEIAPPVRRVLDPMFAALRTAKSTRVTAEMSLASKANGAPIDVQEGTYQIVAEAPNHVDAHLKGRDQRMRLVCDGQQLITQLTPDAYITGEAPADMNALVSGAPIPFGPFPEFIFSVTLAGVDPAVGLLGGVQEVQLIDDADPLPAPHAETKAHHVRAQRADGVVWDLWIAAGDRPRPLRLDVDLTQMLIQVNQLQLPEGFTYVMETTFSHWETGVEPEASTFRYEPPADAEKFASLDAFLESLSQDEGPHPLLGQPAPALQGELLGGDEVQLKQHRDQEVVVLDFWATWCSPCVAALPVISEVTGQFKDRNVVFYAVNVGEDKPSIEAFLKQQKLDVPVLLDPEGKIADAFKATAIPQTVLIGKDGRVEAVHIGFAGPEALKEILNQQLEVLVEGRPLVTEPAEAEE